MYRHETRIPTIVAIFILVFGLGGSVLLVETSHPLSSSANTSVSPLNMHISNISDTQFSVSYITSKSSGGYLSYSDKNSPWLTAFDDRDADGNPKNYVTHHITLKNLKANTYYYFKIISGGITFDNNGQSFSQNTGPSIATSLTLNPAYGIILNQNNQPANGAIVYLTVGKSAPLSAIVKNGGTWLLPLNNIRTQDLLARPVLGNSEVIQISVYNSERDTSSATTDTMHASPVPTIHLGNNYDFRKISGKTDQIYAYVTETPKVLGLSKENTAIQEIYNKVDILFPGKNQVTTNDNKPFIKGTGIPGKEIIVTVNSTPEVGKTTVGSDGTWSFIPTNILSPGNHSVSITTTDINGKPITLTRTFIVLKSGESVLGDATSSATLTPSEIPTITPQLTFGPTASATPPVTGSIIPTYAFLGLGVLFIFLGLKFLLIP